jgi:hypothetical protein
MLIDSDDILESKRALRERLRNLPFSQKLDMLDAMRERDIWLKSAKAVEASPEECGSRKSG